MYGRGLAQVHLRKRLRNRVGRVLSVVVWDGAVDVMGDVRRADLVVQPVDQLGVGPIDCEESATHVAELFGREVGDVNVGVLQPGVRDEPCVDDEVRSSVERKDGGGAGLRCPPREQRDEGKHTGRRLDDLCRPLARPERLGEGRARPEVVGDTVRRSARVTE